MPRGQFFDLATVFIRPTTKTVNLALTRFGHSYKDNGTGAAKACDYRSSDNNFYRRYPAFGSLRQWERMSRRESDGILRLQGGRNTK